MATPKIDVETDNPTGPFAKFELTKLGIDWVADSTAVVMLDDYCVCGDQ